MLSRSANIKVSTFYRLKIYMRWSRLESTRVPDGTKRECKKHMVGDKAEAMVAL